MSKEGDLRAIRGQHRIDYTAHEEEFEFHSCCKGKTLVRYIDREVIESHLYC